VSAHGWFVLLAIWLGLLLTFVGGVACTAWIEVRKERTRSKLRQRWSDFVSDDEHKARP
jgi:hypothetical protein